MIEWVNRLDGCPSQCWSFVLAEGTPYALFLSWRVGMENWRAFLIPNARTEKDLFQAQLRWSQDVFVEAGLAFKDAQLDDAKAALARLLASRLGITENAIVAARNGYPVVRRPAVTGAQLHQVARFQPANKRRR